MSIKKIAEKAGVSAATVSRVLNNPNYKCSSHSIIQITNALLRKCVTGSGKRRLHSIIRRTQPPAI